MTWIALSPPFTLKQGSSYACTVNQPFFIPDSTVISAFTAQGFSNVQRDTTDANDARYTGTWAGPDEEGVTLPERVKLVLEWQP